MLTRNLTPFLHGTKLTSRRPPQPEMTLVVRGTFTLRPGEPLTAVQAAVDQRFLSGETFAEDDDERAGECLFASDFAEFKLNAEVLFRGACHTPGGKPMPECPVKLTVGAWSKTLRVVGPRVWSDGLLGAAASAPAPFTKMPLTWANAFGGPGFAKNPVGKGLGSELPNVEAAAGPVRGRGDRPEPGGFGPINPAWPPRAGKLGKAYGKAWREKRHPFYAEDFDWTSFHAAPADQQLQGYLRGDEELVLHNLHPTEPIFRARLPGVRVRAFVNDDAARFREIAMTIDTLLVDTDREVVEITYRGVTAVRDMELADVKTLLIASEAPGQASLPESHYREVLAAFEKDPVGLEAAMPPEWGDVIRRDRDEKEGRPAPLREGLDPISARIDQKLGVFGAGATTEVGSALEKMREKMASQRAARESLRSLPRAPGASAVPEPPEVDIDADVARVARQMDDSPPAPRTNKPGAFPGLGLRRSMRALMEQAASARKALRDENIPAEDRARALAKVEELESVPSHPRWRELDPYYQPPEGPASTEAPGPGRDLSEQDLTGRDLRGMDLRGANLEEAILTRADLSGADLSGARMRDAVLFRTNLEGANLRGADLTRVNAARVHARGADLTGATLDLAFFEDADLTGATLVEVHGAYSVFTRARLAGANADRSSFEHADMTEVNIEQASFDSASLGAAQLLRCRGDGARLRGAQIGLASFAEASLKGACLADTRGEKAIFTRATLDGADLGHADLPLSHFTEVSAEGALLTCANLPEARFHKARLTGVDASYANLFEADLGRAELSRAVFTRASLYGADLVGASGKAADFTETNLKRSSMERDR